MPSRSLPRVAFGALAGGALTLGLLTGGAFAAVRAPQHAVPNATPTPQPWPLANGHADVFAITATETVTYPNATPVATSYTGSWTDDYQCPVTFNDISGLCADQTYDSTGFSGILYLQYEPGASGSSLVEQFGGYDLYANSGYTRSYTQYWNPYSELLAFPLTVGQEFNSDNYTNDELDALYGPKNYVDLTSSVTNPDGSFKLVEKLSDPAGHYKLAEALEVASNGSARETLAQTGYDKLTETFGVPVVRNGREVIPFTTEGGNPTPATPSPKQVTYVPDWFPGGGPAPSPLQNWPTTYIGQVTMPSTCGTYAGQTAGDFQSFSTYLDPLDGYTITGETDEYIQPIVGDVCEPESFTTTYYDNTNTGNVLYSVTDTLDLVLESEYDPAMGQLKGRQAHFGFGLQLKATPTQHMADVLHALGGPHPSRAGLHTLNLPRTPGERFASLRRT